MKANKNVKKINSLTFSMHLFYKYVKFAVWLLGITGSNHRPNFIKLATRIELLYRLNGSTFCCQYLKECYRLTTKTLGGEAVQSSSEPRVAIRRGLPLIIPGILRLEIEKKNRVVIKGILTVLSVYRVMTASPKIKLETITSPSTGVIKTIPELSLILPHITRFMGRKADKYFNKDKGPFAIGRRLLSLTTAGPNHRIQLLGLPVDAFALSKSKLLSVYEAFVKKSRSRVLWGKLQADIAVGNTYEHFQTMSADQLQLGALGLKHEPAGKVRVFAIVDAWTQSALHPLHQALFDILRNIEQDGTFNQHKPIGLLFDKGKKEMFSFDLSAATDRLPIDLQVQVLSFLYGDEETALLWKSLLIDRDYHLNSDDKDFQKYNGNYRYAVGQPMGALSSWAMLALTHHCIVQAAALRIGHKGWFEDYAVLGDDVVIANKQVADAYLVLMELLGVEINLSKSLVSTDGVCEFAKKIWIDGVDFSPLGPKALCQFIHSPQSFKDIVLTNGIFEGLDIDVLKEQLTMMFNNAPIKGAKWLRKLKSCYWDLIGCFGLNLTLDLSPDLLDSAVSSLDVKNRDIYNTFKKDVIDSRLTKGWLSGLESDVEMYRRIRRFFSLSPLYVFPSCQDHLENYSDLLAHSASHIFEVQETKLLSKAFSNMSRISWPFEDKPKISRRVKSLELSKDLITRIYKDRPDLAIQLFKTSHAGPAHSEQGNLPKEG